MSDVHVVGVGTIRTVQAHCRTVSSAATVMVAAAATVMVAAITLYAKSIEPRAYLHNRKSGSSDAGIRMPDSRSSPIRDRSSD